MWYLELNVLSYSDRIEVFSVKTYVPHSQNFNILETSCNDDELTVDSALRYEASFLRCNFSHILGNLHCQQRAKVSEMQSKACMSYYNTGIVFVG